MFRMSRVLSGGRQSEAIEHVGGPQSGELPLHSLTCAWTAVAMTCRRLPLWGLGC